MSLSSEPFIWVIDMNHSAHLIRAISAANKSYLLVVNLTKEFLY